MNLQKVSIIIILSVLGISIFFAVQLKKLHFDYELERFFPIQNENTLFFEQFRKTFGGDSDYILIGLRNKAGIFQKDFLQKADSLYQIISKIENVEFIHAPTRIRQQVRNRFSSVPIERPWLRFRDERRYPEDSTHIYRSNWANYLFAEDRQSVMIYVRHADFLNEEQARVLADAVKTSSEKIDFEEIHFAGKVFGQTTFIRLIRKETAIFVSVSLVLVILFLWTSYRKIWGILLPLAVVSLSILWTLGLMSMLGYPLDIISNIIPTLLLIIGIADVIHFLTHFLKARRDGQEKWPAVKSSVRIVGKATLITTLTTAIGFLTLTTSSFISLIELGLFATVGIVVALVLTYTFLPALMLKMGSFDQKGNHYSGFWEKILAPCFDWTLRNQRSILWISGIIAIVGIVGAFQIRINSYILTDLDQDHPLQKDQQFFGEKFGGARTLEIELMVRDSQFNVFSTDILKELEQVDQYLEGVYGASNLISPSILIASANMQYQFGRKDQYRIPDSTTLIRPLVRRLEKYSGRYELPRLIREDHQKAKITGQIPDWGSYILEQKNRDFKQFLEENFPESKLSYTITGTPHLMDLNNRFLAQNVLKGLFVALLVIALIFAWLFRSARLMLVTLVPNVLPLLVIAGIMGFTGIDLKISTSIIFIIAFGIAVDDSIHFLSRFQKEYQDKNLLEALRASYLSTGKAIVVTSLILLGGFMSFCLSSFAGTFYIGLLVSITLLVALIADLTVLPVLLIKVLKEKE